MSVGALRMPAQQIGCCIIGSPQFSSLHVIDDQQAGRNNAIRVERNGALVGRVRLLERGLATVTERRVEVVSLTQCFPSRSIGGRSEERRVGKECRSRWSP